MRDRSWKMRMIQWQSLVQLAWHLDQSKLPQTLMGQETPAEATLQAEARRLRGRISSQQVSDHIKERKLQHLCRDGECLLRTQAVQHRVCI